MLFDLQLRDNLLTGVVPNFPTVPSSLTAIPSLRNVWLANNMLQGPRPTFPVSLMVDLSGTNSFCSVTAGHCDPQVSKLLRVAGDLGYPEVLSNSWKGNDWTFVACDSDRNVITVNFGKQYFSGTISPAFANLTSLRNLVLSDNNLTGPIPASLARLPQLQVLDVSNNNLSGEIPKFSTRVTLATAGNSLLAKAPSPQGSPLGLGMVADIVISVILFVGLFEDDI